MLSAGCVAGVEPVRQWCSAIAGRSRLPRLVGAFSGILYETLFQVEPERALPDSYVSLFLPITPAIFHERYTTDSALSKRASAL